MSVLRSYTVRRFFTIPRLLFATDNRPSVVFYDYIPLNLLKNEIQEKKNETTILERLMEEKA
ncbi:hypothetical protein BTS2_1528 [Bacillus sp. TS-2]|nr:hypothetical protein BTS2_1528 [Bacillus sp. TS-2]